MQKKYTGSELSWNAIGWFLQISIHFFDSFLQHHKDAVLADERTHARIDS